MNSEQKQRLVDLGVNQLADALLELASRDDVVDNLVERMIATPQENIKRFKAKLRTPRCLHAKDQAQSWQKKQLLVPIW